ncbi:MAG: hypothetical protein ACJA06_001224 [Halocynthiibacter sp.]|jgi:hypothetical protein
MKLPKIQFALSKTATATALALTLALTSVAASPARAGSDREAARVLAGALALFAIGAAIENGRKQEQAKSTTSNRRDPYPRDTQTRSGHGRDRGDHNFRRRHDRPAKIIPAICAYGRKSNQQFRYISERCLDNNMRGARGLPRRCEAQLQTRRGERTFFKSKCLTREGYRIEARR